jgi:hypothetical protein
MPLSWSHSYQAVDYEISIFINLCKVSSDWMLHIVRASNHIRGLLGRRNSLE